MTKRVFYHYADLEEHEHGMWRMTRVEDREGYIESARALMADPRRFLAAMMRAVEEWPRSCEAAFTADSMNHRAWMGHAGCCIGVRSPEDLTRLGWHRLSSDQQDLANAAADEAIAEWRRRRAMTGGFWDA